MAQSEARFEAAWAVESVSVDEVEVRVDLGAARRPASAEVALVEVEAALVEEELEALVEVGDSVVVAVEDSVEVEAADSGVEEVDSAEVEDLVAVVVVLDVAAEVEAEAEDERNFSARSLSSCLHRLKQLL